MLAVIMIPYYVIYYEKGDQLENQSNRGRNAQWSNYDLYIIMKFSLFSTF